MGSEIWKQEAERQHVWAVGPLGGGDVPDSLPGIRSHCDCPGSSHWVKGSLGQWLVFHSSLCSVPRTVPKTKMTFSEETLNE